VTSWRRLVGALGAECCDLDVAQADSAELKAALLKYQLLIIRNQRLSAESFTEFAAQMGELDVYPFAQPLPGYPHVVTVVKEAQDVSNFGGAWHSDTSYVPEPPATTLLYAVEVPATGGDTLFADMYGPFDRLSNGFKELLESLVGHNTASLVHEPGGSYGVVAGGSVTLKENEAVTEADHPLVTVHPASGRHALFFSLIHTAHFVGMSREESLPLLQQLQALVTEPSNITRLRWQPGTLAIWDNRAVQHYPLNDYPGERREMRRIILKGDRPRGPAWDG